jgi:hypothetical protein
MFYLVITASIINKFGVIDAETRKTQYLTAISETLQHLPSEITPIIIENNGTPGTYLDNFTTTEGKPVKIVYTDNNKYKFKNKGINELLDIKEVIRRESIKESDIVIKLTGRYTVKSPAFFMQILEESQKYDGWIKYYNVCTQKMDRMSAVTGCYALRCIFFALWNPMTVEVYDSIESAFARYSTICTARICEIESLDVECCFAENFQVLRI